MDFEKTLWVSDESDRVFEVPDDTPARIGDGSMRRIGDVTTWDNFEIHVNNRWVSATIVPPPKRLVFEVAVTVPSYKKADEVADRVRKCLDAHLDAWVSQVRVTPLE